MHHIADRAVAACVAAFLPSCLPPFPPFFLLASLLTCLAGTSKAALPTVSRLFCLPSALSLTGERSTTANMAMVTREMQEAMLALLVPSDSCE